MSDFKDYLNEQLKDQEFRKEWEAYQPEREAMQAIIDTRKAQGLTQKALAERIGVNQADISRIERGEGNPTLETLKKIAAGMGLKLQLSFVPM